MKLKTRIAAFKPSMKLKIRVVAFALTLISLLVLLAIDRPLRTNAIGDADFSKPKQFRASALDSSQLNQFSPVFGCADRPPANPPIPSLPAATIAQPITLSRFRQDSQLVATETQAVTTTPQLVKVAPNGLPILGAKSAKLAANLPAPKEVIALADPSNYGDRYLKDLKGRPAMSDPIIVLHETVGSTGSVINYFQTNHGDEDEQASYHTVIALDGTVVYFVPPDKRAFGAGNSEFVSASGRESVRTNPHRPSSVNNFAYHISLETPWDGINNAYTHSGYTEAQYRSLAWLIAKTGVPDRRITTHRAVDRSGERIDPRSFDFRALFRFLSLYPRTKEIAIGCTSQPEKDATQIPPQNKG
ncbi:peptidoglycan recognition family protein [Pseudanabaena sp. PCC 6802]|uniref:peptidoglycan recognition protein family protein n=1 Tax=Pseudanabaena sp. PCC 6802 TaxID=118173 RepID=UPI00034B4F79|nr:peptidoglycan recognition family protein [Pseudanabaena sp. PCC 6802]